MSIAKSPFILGGTSPEHAKVFKRTSGQKIDNESFSEMVGKTSEVTVETQENSKDTKGLNVISRLFANGLAMGEAQHQQNEMVMQSILPQNQQHKNSVPLTQAVSGIPLHKENKGIPFSKGIPLDAKRDIIFSARNIALNRKHGGMNTQQTISRSKTELNTANITLNKTIQNETRIGQLSARFESGNEGISAIGYDRTGGTSYGKYQIASKPGSMDQFIKFLERENPNIAARLKSAGPADTGSRDGKMPQVWRSIAQEQPELFEDLQKRFISESHYQPALKGIKAAGYEVESLSPAMHEVLWSTAVQHGPSGAVRIFTQSANMVGISEGQSIGDQEEQQLIKSIYELRGTLFGSSTAEIQASALRRMQDEKNLALAMLQPNKTIV
ncbi:hypothetical protein K9U34_00250 [Lawsonia intracellularis]|uniref:Type VI secretion system spike protein VgrG3-like C-terminal domain-containing protein n=1 Tax=Lawsonia intracellularis (strain PHE/MN1-00) TaxID=363253 RepID=Q1MR15_LAWIP|nr:hypothetical protein [Lawsonia intracellularis]AGC49921.1 hypothetical protein LAW_00522 [Lawsonia intracellularis N343]KAA0205419.1 hypothetical protein C4K43_02895 [Lawsonia intracellularis]MBZ3892041.1 hypothetical protein [Lawsonia intracellularis]RBN32032.1 hypothetical protein DR194_03480 [Lawsonia intracellularis]RBN33599.1 hypothetical protein DR192_03495 [Lawsonia intracellularis]